MNMKKTMYNLVLILGLGLGLITNANAFEIVYDNGLVFDSSQGMVGLSYDQGGGSTLYHNFNDGFSGTSYDMGASTLYLEVYPGSLDWAK